MYSITAVYLILFIIVAFSLRVIYLFCNILSNNGSLFTQKTSLRTILCIGSGGHTTELLKFSTQLNFNKYKPRLYILADTDQTSEIKIHNNEDSKKSNYSMIKIPRSRHVNQSYKSSVGTTLYATLITLSVVYKFKPDIVFCNGPGTCIPVCIVAFLLRCLFILDCRIVFIESVCRVRTLSLSGKILQYFADVFVVQWPQLRDSCIHSKYFGRLT